MRAKNTKNLSYLLLVAVLLLVTVSLSWATETSNLPIVHINTYSQTIPDEPKITASMGVIWNPLGESKVFEDAYNNYNGFIGIELRGNSSQNWPKKPYKLETRTEDGSNNNVSLLGMPKENDWILHAPFVDKSLMRNAMAYRTLSEMGHYSPKYKHCELYINNNYKGVYLLMESLKLDKNRIDISRANDTNLTGGYLLEITTINRLSDGEPYIQTNSANDNQAIAIAAPKDEEFTTAHRTYIQNYINDLDEALSNSTFTGTGDYKNLIDVSTFVDQMLVAEVYRQLDTYYASTYFHKDMDGKLKMGPGWDFNRSIGNARYADSWRIDGFWMEAHRHNDKVFWPRTMYEDPAFISQCISRYKELRKNVFSIPHFNTIIDWHTEYLDDARTRDYIKWPISDRNLNTQYQTLSYADEVVHMKSWLSERISWLDEQWAMTYNPVFSEIYVNSTDNQKQWIELFNPHPEDIDISGWKISLKNGGDTYTIPQNSVITSLSYFVICRDRQDVLVTNQGLMDYTEGLSFTYSSDQFSLQLFDDSDTKVEELLVDPNAGWPLLSEAGNYSIGYNTYHADGQAGFGWNWSAAPEGTPGLANEIFSYQGLIISEVMSSNANTVYDDYNEAEDWIELYNGSNHTINLIGLYLSDSDTKLNKWEIENDFNQEIPRLKPGETILIWADEDGAQGLLHANFKLSSLGGEAISLSYYNGYNNVLLDRVEMPALLEGQSYVRQDIHGGSDWIVSNTPSPDGILSSVDEMPMANANLDATIYPNPAIDYISLDFHLEKTDNIAVEILGISGVKQYELMPSTVHHAGHYTYTYSLLNSNLASGIYMVRINTNSGSVVRRLIKL